MRTIRRRLEQVEEALSPREAFLLWMAEAHEHGSLSAFIETLKDLPDDAYPLYRLPGQVERATMATSRA